MKTLLFLAAICLISSCSTAEEELAEKGGYSFVIRVQERMDEAGAKIPITVEEVEQAMRVIEGRLEGMGIAGMIVTREGDRGILLKVPGLDTAETRRISAILEKTSRFGLHEVSPRNDETDADGKTLAQRVADGDEIVPGYRSHILKGKDGDGNETTTPILLNRRTALDGDDIAVAVPSANQPDAVDVTLDHTGADKMIALTKDMRPGLDRIAIVLDGEVVSAPVLTQTPLGKHFMITGLDGPGEAQALAMSLMHPLENALFVEDLIRIPPAAK